jgi:3-phenylpropionate/cinnamic acid dioxygenase small subunit
LDERLFARVYEHLMDEAALLDTRQFLAWHATLAEDVHYAVYANLVRMQGEEGPSGAPLFLENLASLRTRCEQLSTPGMSIADNPPAATRHFVTNVRLRPSEVAGTRRVDSNILVYRSRGSDLPPYFFSASREDVLRDSPQGLRLLRRVAKCDDAIIGTRNLNFFV